MQMPRFLSEGLMTKSVRFRSRCMARLVGLSMLAYFVVLEVMLVRRVDLMSSIKASVIQPTGGG